MAKTYLRTGRISWSPLTTAQQAMLANVNGIAIGSTFSATLDSPTETFLIGNGVISVPTTPVVASSGDTAGDVPVDNGDGTYSWTTPSGGSGSPTGAAGGDLAGTYPDPTVPGLATEATARAAADALLAPLASPALTGTPTAPTAAPLDNSTKLGTTAYADAAVLVEKTRALAAEGTSAGRNAITGGFHATGYGAKADAHFLTDAAMTSAAATLTSASAPFVVGDVGKTVVINNAKGAGVHLYTTISAYISATQVTLAANATATVSAAFGVFGTDDTTAVQAAITAAGAAGAGSLVVLPPSPFITTAALTDSVGVNILGPGCTPTYGSQATAFNSINVPVRPPYLTGCVQVVAAASVNGITLSTIGTGHKIRGFGVLFAGLFNATGHGIQHMPPTYLTAKDNGLFSGIWDDLIVFGHDGAHYAYHLTNPICSTFRHLHFFGGGGLTIDQNTPASGHYGNMLVDHIYGQLFVPGTAHGVRLSVTAGSQLNLMVFDRPQVLSANYATTFPGYGLGALNAGQLNWFEDASVQNVVRVGLDLEGSNSFTLANGNAGYISPGSYVAANGPTGNPAYPVPIADFTTDGAALSATKAQLLNDGLVINPRTDSPSTWRSPVIVGAGAQVYVASAGKPAWSDGNDYRYADGSVAFIAGTPGGAGTIPSSVSTGPVGWWAADTLSPADGSAVSSWTDSAASPHALVQATGSAQPIWKANLLNSKPAIRFNASQPISGGGTAQFVTGAFTLNNGYTITLVYKAVGMKALVNANTLNFLDGATNGTAVAFFKAYSQATLGLIGLFAGSNLTFNGWTAADLWAIVTFQFAGASSLIRVNGTQVAAGAGGSANPAGVTLGAQANGTNPARVDIAECVVFNTALSSANMLAVERWLATKYALASA